MKVCNWTNSWLGIIFLKHCTNLINVHISTIVFVGSIFRDTWYIRETRKVLRYKINLLFAQGPKMRVHSWKYASDAWSRGHNQCRERRSLGNLGCITHTHTRVCARTRAHTHTHTYTHKHTNTQTHLHTHTHKYNTNARLHKHKLTHTHTHTHIHTHKHTYARMHVRTNTHTRTHTYTHTHTHTHTHMRTLPHIHT